MAREFFTPERKRWIARDCGILAIEDIPTPEPRHEFHPPSRKGYGAPGGPRTNWPKPIDSIARRFVTIRVIRVSNPSERDNCSDALNVNSSGLRGGAAHFRF